MTISLTVTDGTNTVTLTATDAYLEQFEHIAADPLATSVVERQTVSFIGGNSAIDANLQELDLLFVQARRYHEERVLPQVFINFSLDGTTTWRSEVFSGRVVSTGNIVKYERATGVRSASVIWERAPYWEGPEAQIPLTNGNDTDDLDGLAIWNHDDSDAGDDNWVQIAAASVTGDLPAPCRIQITNTFNSATAAYTYFIGHNWFSDPANFAHVLEAENADYPTTGDTSSASYSNGEYKTIALPATLGYLMRWDLDATFLSRSKGNYFRMLALFTATPSPNTWLKAKLTFPMTSILTTVAESPAVKLDGINVLQEIGVLQIPPWLPGETSLAGVTLALYGYDAATPNLGIDYIQLFALDGYRKLTPAGYGLPYNAVLVDDRISENVYVGLTGKSGYYVGTGDILLQPNKLQRLYFLCTSSTGGGGIDRTATIKVYYRPRRSSL